MRGILQSMTEKILFVGDDIKKVNFLATKAKESNFEPFVVPDSWNRASPLSARSVIYKAVQELESVDKAIVVFNSEFLNKKYQTFSTENITMSFDSMILGYTYMVSELIKFFSEKNKGHIVFLLDDANINEKGILTQSAQSAFISFAEAIASHYASSKLYITLIKNDDDEITPCGDWLFQFLENASTKKAAASVKGATHWIKQGGKAPVVLPFIGK